MSKISIVVPMYNEQESLGILYKELNRVTDTLPEYEFEYLFVNDGSSDATLAERADINITGPFITPNTKNTVMSRM